MHDDIKWIYRRLDKTLAEISCIIMAIAILLDCLPLSYWSRALERFFDYESDNLFSLALIFWSFITALFIFYMEKMNERCYGVPLKDILQLEKDKNKRKFCFKVVIFGLEMVGLIVVAVTDWPITLIILTMLQFINMIYTILTVYINTSKETVLKMAKEEFEDVMKYASGEKTMAYNALYKQHILIKLISKLDYSKEEDTEELLKILLSEKAYRTGKGTYVIRELVKKIMQSVKEREKLYLLMKNWISSDKIPIDLKNQIFFSFIERGETSDFKFCAEIIKTIEDETKNYMLIFCIVCNYLFMDRLNQDYRKYFSDEYESMLVSPLSSEQVLYAWRLWNDIKKEGK